MQSHGVKYEITEENLRAIDDKKWRGVCRNVAWQSLHWTPVRSFVSVCLKGSSSHPALRRKLIYQSMRLHENVICGSLGLFPFLRSPFSHAEGSIQRPLRVFHSSTAIFLWDRKFIRSALGGTDVLGEWRCFNE